VCRHLRKGLEQGNLKKALVNVEWNICQDCKTDNKVKDKPEEEAEDPSVWLCLKCGHQVCSDLINRDFRKLWVGLCKCQQSYVMLSSQWILRLKFIPCCVLGGFSEVPWL
jgi:hypothetical protein